MDSSGGVQSSNQNVRALRSRVDVATSASCSSIATAHGRFGNVDVRFSSDPSACVLESPTRVREDVHVNPTSEESQMDSTSAPLQLPEKVRKHGGDDRSVDRELSMPSRPIYLDNVDIYHEKQSLYENGCLLHAFNNAVGYQALTCDQVDLVLQSRLQSAWLKGVDSERLEKLGTPGAKLWSRDVFHQAVMKYTPFKLVRLEMTASQLVNMTEDRMFIVVGPRITTANRKEWVDRKKRGLKIPRSKPVRHLHCIAVRPAQRAVIDSFHKLVADLEYGIRWSLLYIFHVMEVVRRNP